MNSWRPSPQIRVKALGLHWRDGKLLAAEVRDDAGHISGVRPLGGSIEFGETARAAVIREFQEELGITVTTIAPPIFFENIYTHEGAQGHEMLVLFEVTFPPGAFAGTDRISFHENDGTACVAEWHDLDQLDLPGGPQLFPSGLKAYLRSGER